MIDQESGDALIQATRELVAEVRTLKDRVERDYANRSEIEAKYASKYTVSKRRTQAIIILFLAIVASYFITVGTTSYCFLDQAAATHGYCQILPGFDETQARNAELVHEFRELQKRSLGNKAFIKHNRRVLANHEKRLEQIERQLP